MLGERNMDNIVINRRQFLLLKQIFEDQDITEVKLKVSSNSGIGEHMTVEFEKKTVIDITDYSSW
jgi:hypothetical protein